MKSSIYISPKHLHSTPFIILSPPQYSIQINSSATNITMATADNVLTTLDSDNVLTTLDSSKTQWYHYSRIESELHATRLRILEEIVRRRCAEETVIVMRGQWERICNFMTEAGLTLPAPPAASDNMQIENNSIDQEVVVTRFVAEAIERGIAHAEAEEAEDQEILRPRDRLHYYEIANHELAQRKLVEEVARKQKEKKRRGRQRWIWSLMGLSIGIGASFVAYSYIPNLSSLKSSDAD